MRASRSVLALVAVSLALGSGMASAVGVPIDVAATVDTINAQSAPIALIATAVFAIHVGIKAFKWVRKAMA